VPLPRLALAAAATLSWLIAATIIAGVIGTCRRWDAVGSRPG